MKISRKSTKVKTLKIKSKHPSRKPRFRLSHGEIHLARGVEVFAILSSLFWGVEATSQTLKHPSSTLIAQHAVPAKSMRRSLASLGVPQFKPGANDVEYFQPSQFKGALQDKLVPAPVTLAGENPALTFKQSPYFSEAQFELLRFPTFWKK